RAGHGDRQRTDRGNVRFVWQSCFLVGGFHFRLHLLQVAAFCRRTGTVVAIELVRLRIPHDRERVAADAVQHRLCQSEHRVRGDRRVHRAAALLQDFDGGERGQRLFGRRHAVLRQHRRARGPGRSRVAVAAAHVGARRAGHKRQRAYQRGHSARAKDPALHAENKCAHESAPELHDAKHAVLPRSARRHQGNRPAIMRSHDAPARALADCAVSGNRSMRRSPRIVLFACAVALAGCAAHVPSKTRPSATVARPAAPAVASANPLILVSIDGYRADYLQRGLSPNLEALASRGVRAQWMIPSFPTLTFPNHYTLVTGLYPDHHGIVANEMEDPSIQPDHHFTLKNREAVGDGRWWDEATPLWVSVQRQGGHAATMFWPGSEAQVHGVRPDHWHPFDAKITPEARVDQVLQWLDLPRTQRPRFITLYFDQVDHQAHGHGPDSNEVDAALRQVDAALGRLIEGLKQRGLFDTANL